LNDGFIAWLSRHLVLKIFYLAFISIFFREVSGLIVIELCYAVSMVTSKMCPARFGFSSLEISANVNSGISIGPSLLILHKNFARLRKGLQALCRLLELGQLL
jgi:hypothetical protein